MCLKRWVKFKCETRAYCFCKAGRRNVIINASSRDLWKRERTEVPIGICRTEKRGQVLSRMFRRVSNGLRMACRFLESCHMPEGCGQESTDDQSYSRCGAVRSLIKKTGRSFYTYHDVGITPLIRLRPYFASYVGSEEPSGCDCRVKLPCF